MVYCLAALPGAVYSGFTMALEIAGGRGAHDPQLPSKPCSKVQLGPYWKHGRNVLRRAATYMYIHEQVVAFFSAGDEYGNIFMKIKKNTQKKQEKFEVCFTEWCLPILNTDINAIPRLNDELCGRCDSFP